LLAVIARRLVPALAAAALLLAGCGGDDFSGASSVPTGYAKYSKDGVTLVYPKGWKANRRQDSDGGTLTRFTPPNQTRTPFAQIVLTTSPNAAKRFKTSLEGRRAVMKQVAHAHIDSDKTVDVPGAKEAHRLKATVPPGEGTEPAAVKSDSLDILRDSGDAVTVVAAAPKRKGDDDLDPAKVIESVRLN
jgi:hypothetical protein